MSRPVSDESWGPRDQQLEPVPAKHGVLKKAAGWFLLALVLHGIIDPGGPDALDWSVKAAALLWLATLLMRGVRTGQIPIDWLIRLAKAIGWWLNLQFARRAPLGLVEYVSSRREHARHLELGALEPVSSQSLAEDVRDHVASLGGGVYLGLDEDGGWVTADPESAVMVLGPPRSGKTSAVMIPALLGSSGPAISTSTKPDVMHTTMDVRSRIGEVWLFDPSGHEVLPEGVRPLSWSPVASAATWDQALVMARAMTAATSAGKGTTNENHWTERAANLLAPLLFAANQTNRPIEDVLLWTLANDLGPALTVLGDLGAMIAANVLIGIQRTDGRERSSIFSAAAGVLSAYNSDAVRATATDPNFDPRDFVSSRDTIYITAPEQDQALCAPLIVGLLEEIRHAVYDHARTNTGDPREPMTWLLDEVSNTAPIHDLPALISQAGGQNLQVVIGLQDLSQARTRWGDAAADGFMSLFQTRLLLEGIGDSRTLESISLALGEYDRRLISTSTATNESGEWLTPPGSSEGVSYQTHRQRVLSPGEIAQPPQGHALLLRGASWGLVELTRWYQHDPWASVCSR
jgi:type IV secretory pathway TraG/TraD family ATPase VirD4